MSIKCLGSCPDKWNQGLGGCRQLSGLPRVSVYVVLQLGPALSLVGWINLNKESKVFENSLRNIECFLITSGVQNIYFLDEWLFQKMLFQESFGQRIYLMILHTPELMIIKTCLSFASFFLSPNHQNLMCKSFHDRSRSRPTSIPAPRL